MKRTKFLLIAFFVIFASYCALDAGYSYWTDYVIIGGNAKYSHNIELIRIDAVIEEDKATQEETQADEGRDDANPADSETDTSISGSETDTVIDEKDPEQKMDKSADETDDKQADMEGGQDAAGDNSSANSTSDLSSESAAGAEEKKSAENQDADSSSQDAETEYDSLHLPVSGESVAQPDEDIVSDKKEDDAGSGLSDSALEGALLTADMMRSFWQRSTG